MTDIKKVKPINLNAKVFSNNSNINYFQQSANIENVNINNNIKLENVSYPSLSDILNYNDDEFIAFLEDLGSDIGKYFRNIKNSIENPIANKILEFLTGYSIDELKNITGGSFDYKNITDIYQSKEGDLSIEVAGNNNSTYILEFKGKGENAKLYSISYNSGIEGYRRIYIDYSSKDSIVGGTRVDINHPYGQEFHIVWEKDENGNLIPIEDFGELAIALDKAFKILSEKLDEHDIFSLLRKIKGFTTSNNPCDVTSDYIYLNPNDFISNPQGIADKMLNLLNNN